MAVFWINLYYILYFGHCVSSTDFNTAITQQKLYQSPFGLGTLVVLRVKGDSSFQTETLNTILQN